LQIGFKPAGGIKTTQDLLEWMTLVKEMLGNDWFTNIYFRIGASSLLDNIITEIEEYQDQGMIEMTENVEKSKAKETF
jgi:deoxyribose-phosphate aldolase